MVQSNEKAAGQGLNLLRRGVSGAAVVAVILAGLRAGGAPWTILVAVLALLSLAEFYGMVSRKFKVSRGIGFIAALLILFGTAEGLHPASASLVLCVASFTVLFVEIIRRQINGTSYAIWNMGGTVAGIIYIVIPWSLMILLRRLPSGAVLLFVMFLSTWTCDVAAFLIGSRWGRTPLCENVSPKKTWEGFVGGLSGAILAGVSSAYFLAMPPMPFLCIGVICGIAGQLGDLAESVIKRETGVKDSGKLIPGHGGVLDRFDSVLVSSLLVYVLFGVILR